VTRYRTKPQTVEAVQWRGDNEAEIIAFFPKDAQFFWGVDHVIIRTPENINMTLFERSWVARDSTGYTLFDDEVFELHYEKIEPREENEGSN